MGVSITLFLGIGNVMESAHGATDDQAARSEVVFEWAEYIYPQYFSPLNSETFSFQDYLVREYGDTETYLGTQGERVYVYGALFSGDEALELIDVGAIDDLLTAAALDGFSVDVSSGLVINEAVPKAVNDGVDWFELYNSGTAPINLSAFTIVDDADDHTPAALPNVSLNPGAYIVIYATDEDPGGGVHWVPFKLGSDDSLTLYLGDTVADSLEWDDNEAPEGYSYGIVEEGSDEPGLLLPTPAAQNSSAELLDAERVMDVHLEMSESDWQSILADPLAEEYKQGNITFDGVTLENVAIRTKGNSSLTSVARTEGERYSLKVDMNYYVSGQKLQGYKKLNFNNNFNNPSYMREVISYDLMRELGVPAPKTAYVNLYINEVHWGLYTAVEEVDSQFIERHFFETDGDLYKPDGTGSDLKWLGSDFSAYSGVEPESNEESSDHSAFISFVDTLNNQRSLEGVADADEILRYLAVSTALSNLDSYQGSLGHNYYIYEQNGRFVIIPWDLNESFGRFNNGCTTEELTGLLVNEPTPNSIEDRPLVARVLDSDGYLSRYHQYLQQLIDGPLQITAFTERVEGISTLIRDHVSNDPTAFYSLEAFDQSLYQDTSGAMGLTSFIEARVASMQSQLNGEIPSTNGGAGSCSAGNGFGPGQPPNVIRF